MIRFLLVLLVAFTIAAKVGAHSPGLSRVDIEVSAERVKVNVGLARRSFEILTDAVRESHSTTGEFASQADLDRAASSIIELWVGGDRVAHETRSVEVIENDGVRIELVYPVREPRSLEIRSPWIAKLGRGHRQLVSVATARGFSYSELLAADRQSVFMTLSEKQAGGSVFTRYLTEGVRHIWIGFDHLLFLLALLLPTVLLRAGRLWTPVHGLKSVLLNVTSVVTAFTLAHSITLTLAALGWVSPPSRGVETVIAATIIMAGVNNLYPFLSRRRWTIAFSLGLVHGFGFAGALGEIGLPADQMLPALAAFNIGVELGQLTIVALFVPAIYLVRATRWYRPVMLIGGSMIVVLVAAVWLFERAFAQDLIALV